MKRQMNYRDCLTSEMITKHFKSQFDLVRYAIEEATASIRAGLDAHNPSEDNIVTEVLDHIAESRMGTYNTTNECSRACDEECEVELEEIEEEVEEKPKSRKRVKV